MDKQDSPDRQRAMLYIAQPELARAALAPPFSVTTVDGNQISLDDVQGKSRKAEETGEAGTGKTSREG